MLSYPATEDRPAATATVICSLEADLPTSLEVYGSSGRIMIDDFFILPKEMLVYRGHRRDVAPEVLVTQWPGGGYTFQAQEVMRCVRAGRCESPMVPWRDSLAVARTLALWQAAVGDAPRNPTGGIMMERLTGVIQPYAWGSRTAIPELLGVAPTGEPQAELWFGAHPLAPSTVDGEPLDKMVDSATQKAWSVRPPWTLRPAAALSAQDDRRRISRCPCRPIRHASRPRPGMPGSRRPGFRGMRRTGPIATAGRSRRCCARCVETEALCGFREPG